MVEKKEMGNEQETSSKTTLTQVLFETSELVQTLIENGGELTPEIEASLEQNNIVLAGKLDAYGHVWERMVTEEAHWKNKADEYLAVAKSCKKVRERLKERMKYGMQQINKTELAGSEFKFKLTKTSGTLVIDDEEQIPRIFKKQIVSWEFNKARIKEAINLGQAIPGAHVVKEPSIRKYVHRK